jgi:hypothetical protein
MSSDTTADQGTSGDVEVKGSAPASAAANASPAPAALQPGLLSRASDTLKKKKAIRVPEL